MFGRALIRFAIAFFALLLGLHSFFSHSPVSTGSDTSPGWFFFGGGDGGSWSSGGDSGSWDSGGDGGSWGGGDSGGGDSGGW